MGVTRASFAVFCLAGALSLTVRVGVARGEPLPSALEPERSHTGDEREFPPATLRAYRQVMEQGLTEFLAGRWAEARALFHRGHMLLPNARSSRVLGMTAFNLGLYPAAVRELEEALRDPRRPLQGTLRAQAEQLLADAEALVGRYRVLLDPADAALRVDGLTTKLESDGTLLLPAGSHLLEVEAPRYLSLARTVLVDGNEDGVLVLHLQPNAPGRALTGPNGEQGSDREAILAKQFDSDVKARKRAAYRASWGLGAGSLALGSISLGLYLGARAEQRDLEERCKAGCAPWDPAFGKRDRLEGWSQGLLTTSLVFAVTSAVLALIERDRARAQESRDRKARIAPLREPL